jgi:hypothetical protein
MWSDCITDSVERCRRWRAPKGGAGVTGALRAPCDVWPVAGDRGAEAIAKHLT